MSSFLHQQALQFVEFQIQGRRIKLPYFIAEHQRWNFNKTVGKGSVAEIQNEILRALAIKGLQLAEVSDAQLQDILKTEQIGIDCSGYAYHLLDAVVRRIKQQPLSKYLKRYDGLTGELEKNLLNYQRVRRISAHTLTNHLNTLEIQTVAEMQLGDLLRLTAQDWHGKHVAVVTQITPEMITYTHSSLRTEQTGPHFGYIKITHPKQGLEAQTWLEKTDQGQNYGRVAFNTADGDSVRRLKCLTV